MPLKLGRIIAYYVDLAIVLTPPGDRGWGIFGFGLCPATVISSVWCFRLSKQRANSGRAPHRPKPGRATVTYSKVDLGPPGLLWA